MKLTLSGIMEAMSAKNPFILAMIRNPKIFFYKLLRLSIYLILLSLAFIFIYPFLYMVITSVKSNTDLYDISVNWIPRRIKHENYIIAFRALKYLPFFKNSVIITLGATAGHILSGSFIAYGFARYSFPGRNLLFVIVIIAIIIPVQTLVVPLYFIFANLKWVNTYLPIIIPSFLGFGLRGGLFIFIFRQFYIGLPRALEEAAKVDGCGFLRTYWSIVFPIAKSAFWVTFVISMVWHWNDSYESSIFAGKAVMVPLPARLQALIDLVKSQMLVSPGGSDLFAQMSLSMEEAAVNNAVLMAGTLIIILPIIIVFSFVQRKFIQGVERTGINE